MSVVKFGRTAEIAYETVGDGPLTVIFQHGWSSTRKHFDLVLAELPTDGRIFVMLDLPGHGESVDDPEVHGVEAYARQLLAVADDLKVSQFVTVGHSMGAKFNLYLRLIARERLLGQIAIAPTPAGPVAEEASDETIARMSGLSGNAAAFRALLGQLMTAPVPETRLVELSERAARISPDVLAITMRTFSRSDFERELIAAGVAPPTLVIGGSSDPIYPPAGLVERTARETPSATIRLLDCGHDVPNEKPFETALLIDGFLAAIPKFMGTATNNN